jgi:hypothetical protein
MWNYATDKNGAPIVLDIDKAAHMYAKPKPGIIERGMEALNNMTVGRPDNSPIKPQNRAGKAWR